MGKCVSLVIKDNVYNCNERGSWDLYTMELFIEFLKAHRTLVKLNLIIGTFFSVIMFKIIYVILLDRKKIL